MANAAQRFTLASGAYGQPVVVQHQGTAFPAPFGVARLGFRHSFPVGTWGFVCSAAP
jgi:hypothetical protein